MYECLCGYPPFFANDPNRTWKKITNWKKSLVRHCAVPCPAPPALSC
jgi:hypothetical protein